MNLKFPLLKPNQILVRVQQCKKTSTMAYATFLLYKDARVDMSILDETVGQMNWQREPLFINDTLYTKVSIYDEDKKMWVSKSDVGSESNTEKEKGEASDSFKRACVNWGIGRELYTAPNIFVKLENGEYKEVSKEKITPLLTLRVSKINYNDAKEITELELVDEKGNVKYTYPSKNTAKKSTAQTNSNSSVNNSKEEKKPHTEPKNEVVKDDALKNQYIDAIYELTTSDQRSALVQKYGQLESISTDLLGKLVTAIRIKLNGGK